MKESLFKRIARSLTPSFMVKNSLGNPQPGYQPAWTGGQDTYRPQYEGMPFTNDPERIMSAIPYEQTLMRHRQDIQKWNDALLYAESIHFPNRMELYRLYKETTMDNHLFALMNTRKNHITGSKFIVVDKNNIEIKEKTFLINKKWFHDFIDMAMDSIFYGYSLIQFEDLEGLNFTGLTLVPRQYVRQEFSLVVPTPSSQVGQNYTIDPYNKWTIGVGERRDLGLLAKAAPIVLWKKGSIISWAIYSELFGQPIRVGKLNDRDKKTHDSMANFLKNMGNAPWAVISKDDEIELIESKSSGGQSVFDKLIERCNSELAKLILGQTSTTDTKAFVGTAQVHERVMHTYNERDERFIKHIFDNQLCPLLNFHGFGLEGLSIVLEEDNELSKMDKSVIDLALLEHYDIPTDYILATYGTPVIERVGTASLTTEQITKDNQIKKEASGKNLNQP